MIFVRTFYAHPHLCCLHFNRFKQSPPLLLIISANYQSIDYTLFKKVILTYGWDKYMESGSREESSYTEILGQLQAIAEKSKRNDIQR